MVFPDPTTSLIFAVICLTASVGVVHLSGFIRTDEGLDDAHQGNVKPLLIGGAALNLCLAFVGLSLAVLHMGWAFAVVIAGSTFLIAPFLVEPLPARLRDGALGLCIFIVIATVALAFGLTQTWGG